MLNRKEVRDRIAFLKDKSHEHDMVYVPWLVDLLEQHNEAMGLLSTWVAAAQGDNWFGDCIAAYDKAVKLLAAWEADDAEE